MSRRQSEPQTWPDFQVRSFLARWVLSEVQRESASSCTGVALLSSAGGVLRRRSHAGEGMWERRERVGVIGPSWADSLSLLNEAA